MKIRGHDLQNYVSDFLLAVQDGYETKVVLPELNGDGSLTDYFYIAVTNPKFKEDDGSDKYLVLEVKCG